MSYDNTFKSVVLPFLLILFIALGALIYASFYIVEPGFSAIHLRLGTIKKTTKESGLYFKVPLIDSVTMFDLRIQKALIETTALSKDLQSVKVEMAINYRIQDAQHLFLNVSTAFEKIIIDPFVQESVKAVVAKFDAESLIQKRHEVKELVISELTERLSSKHILLVDFNFTHLDFSDDFIKAVESKQIAEQDAKRAENQTKQVREEATQSRARAEAEAFALKVKRESLTPELIRLKEVEAQIKAIEKWDGRLPRITGASIPLMPVLGEMHKKTT